MQFWTGPSKRRSLRAECVRPEAAGNGIDVRVCLWLVACVGQEPEVDGEVQCFKVC